MVRLKSIAIERFRGIRSGRIDGLADVNILVGRNNTGKSTIAEALTWIAVHAAGAHRDLLDRDLAGLWQVARNERERLHPQLWYCQDTSSPVRLRAELDVNARFAPEILLERTAPQQFEVKAYHGILSEPEGRFARFLTILRPQDAFLPAIEQRLWSELLANRRDKALTASLQDIFGIGVEQLQLPPDGRLLLLFPTYSVPLDAQGDGTRAALRCLMVLSALNETMLVMEEPENHQHPGALDRFAVAICKLAKAQDVQLLLTTHSAECVRAFLKATGAAGSELALFHLKLEDGLLDARRFDAEAVESLFEAGTDVRWLDLYG